MSFNNGQLTQQQLQLLLQLQQQQSLQSQNQQLQQNLNQTQLNPQNGVHLTSAQQHQFANLLQAVNPGFASSSRMNQQPGLFSTGQANQQGGQNQQAQTPGQQGSAGWRRNLTPQARQEIVLKLAQTARQLVQNSGSSQSDESVLQLATKFEQGVFNNADTQEHYLETIRQRLTALQSRVTAPAVQASPNLSNASVTGNINALNLSLLENANANLNPNMNASNLLARPPSNVNLNPMGNAATQQIRPVGGQGGNMNALLANPAFAAITANMTPQQLQALQGNPAQLNALLTALQKQQQNGVSQTPGSTSASQTNLNAIGGLRSLLASPTIAGAVVENSNSLAGQILAQQVKLSQMAKQAPHEIEVQTFLQARSLVSNPTVTPLALTDDAKVAVLAKLQAVVPFYHKINVLIRDLVKVSPGDNERLKKLSDMKAYIQRQYEDLPKSLYYFSVAVLDRFLGLVTRLEADIRALENTAVSTVGNVGANVAGNTVGSATTGESTSNAGTTSSAGAGPAEIKQQQLYKQMTKGKLKSKPMSPENRTFDTPSPASLPASTPGASHLLSPQQSSSQLHRNTSVLSQRNSGSGYTGLSYKETLSRSNSLAYNLSTKSAGMIRAVVDKEYGIATARSGSTEGAMKPSLTGVNLDPRDWTAPGIDDQNNHESRYFYMNVEVPEYSPVVRTSFEFDVKHLFGKDSWNKPDCLVIKQDSETGFTNHEIQANDKDTALGHDNEEILSSKDSLPAQLDGIIASLGLQDVSYTLAPLGPHFHSLMVRSGDQFLGVSLPRESTESPEDRKSGGIKVTLAKGFNVPLGVVSPPQGIIEWLSGVFRGAISRDQM